MMQVPLKLLALGSITHTYETCDDERLRSTGRSVCSIVWVQVPILSAAQQESALGTSFRDTSHWKTLLGEVFERHGLEGIVC